MHQTRIGRYAKFRNVLEPFVQHDVNFDSREVLPGTAMRSAAMIVRFEAFDLQMVCGLRMAGVAELIDEVNIAANFVKEALVKIMAPAIPASIHGVADHTGLHQMKRTVLTPYGVFEECSSACGLPTLTLTI